MDIPHFPQLTWFKTSRMQSIKVANRILLGSVAFSVSFVLGLLANRDLTKALLTGIITIPGTYAGAAIADRRRIYQERLVKGSLQNQIQELVDEESQLYQSLAAATATRQEVEASINALQGERSQLLNRVSDLHAQRNDLYRELSDFQKRKQQQEAEFYTLQTQLQQMERQQLELNQSISAKTFQLHHSETRLNQLKKEIEQLRKQISAKKQQKEQLHPDLVTLESRKRHLEGEAYDLQTQIQVLQQRQEQLNQVLAPLQGQQQEVEASLLAGKAKLDQLLSQISEKRKQQKKLDRDLAILEKQKQQLETEFHNLQIQVQTFVPHNPALTQAPTQNLGSVMLQILPEEWREWLAFTQQLSQDEQRAFKAILEEDRTALKKIADENLTMPEVLIDSINEHAINTFGDTIFESNSASIHPEINEDYSPILRDPITLYFRDLLTPIQDYLSSKANDTVTELHESLPESIEVMNSRLKNH
jgi:chromosome segregation ATPase